MKEKDVLVSIICTAYNHENYIKDALKSFVMQKTNFAFEVLVHDDASTDNTANIIHEYELKYPHIIVPIYQTENQYSKGVKVTATYIMPHVRGKYIALCEGDDYWTNPNKLQKQVEALEQHPEIDICAHAALRIDAGTNKKMGKITPSRHNTIFTVEQVILGGGGFVATNSLMYRKSLHDFIPDFRKHFLLDYTLQIHGAMRGGMLYLKDNMSVYRANVLNSWTNRMHKDKNAYDLHIKKMSQMLSELDRETSGKYTAAIQQRHYLNLISKGNYKEIKSKSNRQFYVSLPLSVKFKLEVKMLFPFMLRFREKIHKLMELKSNE